MAEEIGVEPELLWPLLLVQIIYDELASKQAADPDFDIVARTYREHMLLPEEAPVLSDGAAAQQVYEDLLKEYKVDTSLGPVARAQTLAEPLYTKFHESLLSRMKDDVIEFEGTYRRLEDERDIPRDERLAEATETD